MLKDLSEDSGLLFENEYKKGKNDNQPDYRGELKLSDELIESLADNDGHIQIAIWEKEFENSYGFTASIQEMWHGDEEKEEERPRRQRRGRSSRTRARGARR